MDFDRLPLLNPVNFFALRADCWYCQTGEGKLLDKYLLPTTSDLCQESPFAQVAIAWNEEGIRVRVTVRKVFADGDSVELFFDTRDVKTAGFNTRFCHHFFFPPNHQAEEITHFRTDDRHDLCNPGDLVFETSSKNDSMEIFIPAHCLVGYDPNQFDRLGFNYRISRKGGHLQHFSACSDEFPIEQRPSLWSSLWLKR